MPKANDAHMDAFSQVLTETNPKTKSGQNRQTQSRLGRGYEKSND